MVGPAGENKAARQNGPQATPKRNTMDGKSKVTREELLVTLMLVLTSLALVAYI